MASVVAPSTLPALHSEIAALDSYEPGPLVNRLFDGLVDRVLTGDGPVRLDESAVRELRSAASRAECHLERHWSERIASSDDPWSTLDRFPYVENYRRLARMEHDGLLAVDGSSPDRAVFVGGGPLPLSAVFLADHGWEGTVVDRDPAAVGLARELVAALEVDLDVRLADGDALDYGTNDLVHVAALVGGLDGGGVFERIEATGRPKTTLLARSVRGRRRVLYPPLPDSVFERFDHRRTVHPPADLINSAVYFSC